MKTTKLGFSGIDVSRICLGTMTWGSQNSQNEAFEQMDYALSQGVNFWDTAEAYSVPLRAETYGQTEEMIGAYFQQRQNRDKVVLASKIVGRFVAPPGSTQSNPDWIRNGQTRHDRANVMAAIEDSLKRLNTDYLDLYQLHWPDRPAQRFGIRDFYVTHDDMAPDGNYEPLMLDVLQLMDELIKARKIRSWGLSNETPWGVMKYTGLAEKHNLPKPVSVQNPYGFLDRRDEGGLSEICLREHIAYLPYSALGAGVLSGKYLDGQWPEGSRITNAKGNSRYYNPNCEKAVIAYLALAKEHGLDPCQMALAFCLQQPFVTAPIIGATSMTQLKTNIDSVSIVLSDEVIKAIDVIHNDNPNPGP